MILSHLRLMWTVFCLQLKQVAVNSFVIFLVIVQPLIVALLAIYMLRDTESFQAIYVIVGSAMGGLWTQTLFTSTYNVEFERQSGTLEEIVGSPTHLATVITGKTLANVTLALSSLLFSYPLATLAFGYRLTIAHPFLFAVSLLLTVLALISLGLVIAPLMSLKVGGSLWVNALEIPVYVLGGFLFPVALLPGWTTPISTGLPLARGIPSARMLVVGAPLAEVWPLLVGELAVGLAYALVGFAFFRWFEFQARRRGTLEAL